jgi:hypothetical protein
MTDKFNGSDYVPARDDRRLTGQQELIWEVMKSGKEYTLWQISEITKQPEASISAQLRHLRKPRFGSHEVTKKYVGSGLYTYKLKISEQ